jgi:putative redox protein
MDSTRLATAHLTSQPTRYAQSIRVGRHDLVADEPAALGGTDAGIAPYGLLVASLAACTSITLRMYAERKGWELGEVKVDLEMSRDGDRETIQRTILFGATLSDDQRHRLGEIADKTPVTKTLQRSIAITTTVR